MRYRNFLADGQKLLVLLWTVLFTVLLQEVLLGLKYDQAEYVAACLKTIHRCVSIVEETETLSFLLVCLCVCECVCVHLCMRVWCV